MAQGILIPAYIEGIRTRKDKTVALTIGTQELSPEKAGELFSMTDKLVTAYFSIKDISKDDQDVIDTIEPDLPGKSPSQRMRNILYILWKQEPEGFTDKNLYYLHKMERFIESLKAKIKN